MSMLASYVRRTGPLAAIVDRKYRERVAAGIIKPQFNESSRVEHFPVLKETEDDWTRDHAQNMIPDDLLSASYAKETRVSLREIIDAVCDEFELPMSDILSSRRTKDIIIPRQIVMYLAKQLTPMSFPAIGRLIGGRDHSTVMHGCAAIERKMEDQEVAYRIDRVKRRLPLGCHGPSSCYWGC